MQTETNPQNGEQTTQGETQPEQRSGDNATGVSLDAINDRFTALESRFDERISQVSTGLGEKVDGVLSWLTNQFPTETTSQQETSNQADNDSVSEKLGDSSVTDVGIVDQTMQNQQQPKGRRSMTWGQLLGFR